MLAGGLTNNVSKNFRGKGLPKAYA